MTFLSQKPLFRSVFRQHQKSRRTRPGIRGFQMKLQAEQFNGSTTIVFSRPVHSAKKNLVAISGLQTGYIHVTFRKGCHRFGLFKYHIWLVVWSINFIFPYIGNSNPNWLSYFFRGVGQPPTSHITTISPCTTWLFVCFICFEAVKRWVLIW